MIPAPLPILAEVRASLYIDETPGLLLLFGRFVPLAPTLLAAELYNILAFHLTMSPGTIAPALVACVLWILVSLQYRESFQGHLQREGCDAGINCVSVSEERYLRAECMIGDTPLEWRNRPFSKRFD